MKYIVNIISRISLILKYLCNVAIIIMIVLTVADVIGRYFFRYPLIGVQDILEILIVFLVIGAMGRMVRERYYIRADILSSRLTVKQQAVIDTFCMVVVLIITGLWIWQTTVDIFGSIDKSESTIILHIPVTPIFVFIAFGLAVAWFEILFDILRYMGRITNGDVDEGDGERMHNADAATIE